MKLIKIRKFAIGLAAISVALIQFGCEQDWQKDFESSVLASANTVTVSVNAVEDSTAIVNYTLSTIGRVFIAVVPGTDETETPDPQNLLKLTVADAVFAIQIIKDNASELTGSVNVPGLIQNTSYKVYALPVNIDGVLGTVATTDAFETSDSFNPTLDLDAGISPAISSSAAQSTDFDITLTFSEPVVLAPDFDIQIGYRDAETKLINWVVVDNDNISISSNKVIINQMQSMINGQYVFLTIAQGAITDRTGNPFDGVTSGIIDNKLAGIYWRVSKEAKVALEVLPDPEVYVTDPSAFDVIKLVYPYELNTLSLDDYESSMIKVRYYDGELEENYNIPVGDIVIDKDTLEITIPKAGIYGSYIYLSIEEGTVWDVYGNDIAAVDFEDCEWFISYGYTRDKIVGEYTIEATFSNMYGPISKSYDITIAKDSEVEENVIITGFLGSTDAIIAKFDGDLAIFTIELDDPENYLGQMVKPDASYALGDTLIEFYNGFNDTGNSTGFIESDGSISFNYFDGNNLNAIISLAKEVPQPDGSFSYEGWWEQWLTSTFVPKAVKGSESSIKYNNVQIPDLTVKLPEVKLKK